MKLSIFSTVLALLGLMIIPFSLQAQEIQWMTWEEAVKHIETQPKKIFVDIYTEWCGWCKRMDQTTFKDPEVVKYMNKHFYAVKFDAEMKKDITFRDHTFSWVASGRRGVHMLAYSLLEGKLSYPSFVMLNEKFDRIAISPGYKQPEQLMKELHYAAEEKYRESSWEEYLRESGSW